MKHKPENTPYGIRFGEAEISCMFSCRGSVTFELDTPWMTEHGGGALTIRVTPKGRVRIWNDKLELKK